MMNPFWRSVLFMALFLVWSPSGPVWAHLGAPYVVLPEQAAGPYTITVWADPDLGTGTFFIGVNRQGRALHAKTVVTVWAQPAGGNAAGRGFQATARANSNNENLVARVPFDAEGLWRIRLTLTGPAGDAEVRFNVQVTPPYPGALKVVLWLLPFLAVATLWFAAAFRQSRPSAKQSQGRRLQNATKIDSDERTMAAKRRA